MSTYVGPSARSKPASSTTSSVSSPLTGPAAVAYDFRSDTVTQPTPAMLATLATAPFGDDVFSEDPSITSLELHVAQLLNKPAAVFVTSGTLANQLAIRAHLALNGGGPPHSVLCDSRAHVTCWEAGGIPAHTGAAVIGVPVEKDYALGLRAEPYLTAKDVTQLAITSDDEHCAPTRLVCVENTCNGAVMPLAEVQQIGNVARSLGMRTHMDGARLWNACVATGDSPSAYAAHVDSVSVCLSKGIGAPVGSVLVGEVDVIKRARHLRKMYGGGWRQAGVLAAAARFALDHVYPGELQKTHNMARCMGDELVKLGAKLVNVPAKVETNMVFVDWSPLGWTCDQVAKAIEQEAQQRADGVAAIKVFGGSSPVMRLVFHYQLAEDAVDRFVAVVKGLKEEKEQ
ncbi:pyridoxal phosphate-dependent transferase [Catenaria anguillulae PL171]|uniref:Pyridoxal phosphate-dependent transferase n=1 Tax=Catenaria anguillulae PL171 TaxID=765915 RepID=A0A1Y2HZV1_9FUNG|nr:pyridoxal phosphate-dependent transferase [Catenaria anguillulae PL171]